MPHLLRFDRQRARRRVGLALAALLLLPALPVPQGVAAGGPTRAAAPQEEVFPSVPAGSAYIQTNHSSDLPGVAFIQDPLLVNPWGISMTSSSPFWIANQGTNTASLYRGDVGGSPLVRNPGLSSISIPAGSPTGTVAYTGSGFRFNAGGAAAGPARFMFATLTGAIAAWNPGVPAAGSTTAVTVRQRAGRVYTGLAIGTSGGSDLLYAADTAGNRIDVYDSTFTSVEGLLPGHFVDPSLPPGYTVFNIHNLGGQLYVTYTLLDPVTHRALNAPGNGVVNIFNTDGTFVRRVTSGGVLNAPWGLAIAPASFGLFSGRLLVGNFGEDGPSINAYNQTTGAFLGSLVNEAGVPIQIDELWALQFGNGGNGGDPNTLYFTAGIAEETHGLFGSLKPTTSTAASLIQFGASDFAINEGAGHIDITVTRSGDASGTSTISYATFDEAETGHASQKSDYEIALGRLTFGPGETSKTFRVLVVDDNFVEGDEEVNLVLSNPTGAGLGSPNQVELTILDNDTTPSTTNPIDTPSFFVRQHYLDFLNREPDPSGFAFWTGQVTGCGATDPQVCRINVSAAFFLSPEFQQTGTLAYLSHKAAFGPDAGAIPGVPVLYGTFERDLQALQRGLVLGEAGYDAQLEANKTAFFNEFVTRPEFVAKYGSLSNEAYVDALLANAGLSPKDFVVNLTNSQESPPANPTLTNGTPRPASFGTARFVINSTDTAMTMTATVNNIDFTGSQTADTNDNLTNAHIHASSTEPPPPTRPVVWGFIGMPFNDDNPNDVVVTPFASGVGGTVSAKWDAPEGNNTTLAAQLPNIRAGRAYVNFHTVQFGGGEIRGNFPATQAFRDALVNGLNGATETRASVLRKIAESPTLAALEFNRFFVTMEYFGYLRRDPDAGGFAFWLNKLNSFGGDYIRAEMVKAFITSSEYRQRFGAS